MIPLFSNYEYMIIIWSYDDHHMIIWWLSYDGHDTLPSQVPQLTWKSVGCTIPKKHGTAADLPLRFWSLDAKDLFNFPTGFLIFLCFAFVRTTDLTFWCWSLRAASDLFQFFTSSSIGFVPIFQCSNLYLRPGAVSYLFTSWFQILQSTSVCFAHVF